MEEWREKRGRGERSYLVTHVLTMMDCSEVCVCVCVGGDGMGGKQSGLWDGS